MRLVLMPQNGISLPFRLNILGQAKKRTQKRLTVHLAVSLGLFIHGTDTGRRPPYRSEDAPA